MGNISTYTAGGETVTYTYDAQGQLLKAVGDETYTYTYDAAGNILTANGHTYTYGNTNWRDLLTAFDGESITYDAIGNPTSYYNGTRWTFGWTNGRQLTSASNGTSSITYTYTADGMRTSKVVDGVTYNYYYASGKLLRQSWGSNTLDFFYDTSGTPYALKHNGTLYYYITNLQGDVLHLIDGSGNITATYEYDPYGNIISSSGWAATFNPLRYRGYYYDTETGLYYLQSRYYDPTTGRFINADSYASTGQGIVGHNMFAYCLNNPIILMDPHGSRAADFAVYFNGEGSGYIKNQHSEGIGEKQLGFTTVSHGGCGAVATYNAFITLGDGKSFDEILSYFNSDMNRLNVFGFAGIPSNAVAQCFREYGYNVVVTDNFDAIDLHSQIADASILLYAFPQTYYPLGIPIDAYGAHFIEYHRSGNGYIGYNTSESGGMYSFLYPADYGYKGDRYYAVGIFIFK